MAPCNEGAVGTGATDTIEFVVAGKVLVGWELVFVVCTLRVDGDVLLPLAPALVALTEGVFLRVAEVLRLAGD